MYNSIQFRLNKYTREKLRGDTKDPTLEEISKGQFLTELVEIDELSKESLFNLWANHSDVKKGDFAVIGDYSLLYNKPLEFTIVTIIPTEVYYISSYDLIKIVPPEILEKHRKLMKRYPNNVEIRMMYWEKR